MLKGNKDAVLDVIIKCRVREMTDSQIVDEVLTKTGERFSRPYIQKLRQSARYTDRLRLVLAVVDAVLDATSQGTE